MFIICVVRWQWDLNSILKSYQIKSINSLPYQVPYSLHACQNYRLMRRIQHRTLTVCTSRLQAFLVLCSLPTPVYLKFNAVKRMLFHDKLLTPFPCTNKQQTRTQQSHLHVFINSLNVFQGLQGCDFSIIHIIKQLCVFLLFPYELIAFVWWSIRQ